MNAIHHMQCNGYSQNDNISFPDAVLDFLSVSKIKTIALIFINFLPVALAMLYPVWLELLPIYTIVSLLVNLTFGYDIHKYAMEKHFGRKL